MPLIFGADRFCPACKGTGAEHAWHKDEKTKARIPCEQSMHRMQRNKTDKMTDDTILDIGGDVQPGTYLCTLIGLERVTFTEEQDRVDQFGNQHQAGEVVEKLRWTFATDDGAQLDGSTSLATGPRSKMRAWMAGIGVDISKPAKLSLRDLVGRECMVNVALDDGGYAKIASVVAVPVKRAK